MATVDDRRADLDAPPGSTEPSLPEGVLEAIELGVANEALFNGPIKRINNQTAPAVERLAVAELMHRLRGEGISLGDGASASCGAHESNEGVYFVRKGDDRLRYSVGGDFRTYFNGAQAFSFQSDNPGEVSINADAGDIRKVDKMLRALNGALSSTLAELDDALATASTTFDDDQKERVADTLLKLDDTLELCFCMSNGRWYNDCEGRLEIEDRDIERLDSMLKGAQALVELGVRVNPIVLATLKKTVSDLKEDVGNREVRLKGKGSRSRIRVALARALGSISLVAAGNTPPSPTVVEETQRFTACKADILAKLSAFGQTLADLENANLTKLGSDGFVSLGLEYLGHKLPKTAQT